MPPSLALGSTLDRFAAGSAAPGAGRFLSHSLILVSRSCKAPRELTATAVLLATAADQPQLLGLLLQLRHSEAIQLLLRRHAPLEAA